MNLTEKFLQFALVGAEWVLWLLVVLSVISVYVMLERWLFFRGISGADGAVRKSLLVELAEGRLAAAQKLVRGSNGVGARMVAEMLDNAPRGGAAVEAAMNGVRAEEKLRLEHNLSYLGTLGANAPFIGLFGTVLGIIQAFKDLADSGLRPGGESSAAVMEGISHALVATAVGLLVAIPAVVAFNLFTRRVKRTLGEADSFAHTAFTFIAGNDKPAAEED